MGGVYSSYEAIAPGANIYMSTYDKKYGIYTTAAVGRTPPCAARSDTNGSALNRQGRQSTATGP
eukprot:6214021-Pleurochrysis_carterae.AAC.2